MIFLFVFLRMGYISNKNFRENRNTYFTFRNSFFRKLCHLLSKEERNSTAGQATDDKMEYAHFTLGT